jgi:hypothetical protein
MNQGDPTFSVFYADYLAHHRHPWNRALHLAAKLLALAGLAAAVYERSVLLLLAVPVLAVAPCWIGHLLFEGDRPVSWTRPDASLLGSLGRISGIGNGGPRPSGVRPYYSFAADLRMCGAMLGLPARLAMPALPASRGKTGASSEPT